MAETETVVKSTTGRYSGASGTRYAAVSPAYRCRKCTNMPPDSRTSPSIRGKARDTHDRQRHAGAGYARAGAAVDPLWLQVKALSELLHIRQAEVRLFLQGQLPPGRTEDLHRQLLAAG